MDEISGSFIGNYSLASGSSYGAEGGAINVTYASVNNINGVFINNSCRSTRKDSGGGAIKYYYSSGVSIKGDFIGNYASSSNSNGYGGAIALGYTSINNIEGDFINNYINATFGTGGALAIYGNSSTQAKFDNIKGLFVDNYIKATSDYARGGAIYIKDANRGNIGKIEADFYGNYVEAPNEAAGGALYTTSDVHMVNASFIDNYAKSQRRNGYGGAIYSSGNVTLLADGKTNYISGNYVEDREGARPEAIYISNSQSGVTFNSKNEGAYVINDQINGVTSYGVDFTGDSTGKVYLNNDILNKARVSLSDITLYLSNRDDVLNGTSLTLNSGTLNMLNNSVGVSALGSLTLNGDTNFVADVDLAGLSMDRFTADNYGDHTGNLNVIGMNILSDTSAETAEIYFAQEGLKDNVTSHVGDLPDGSQTVVYSPIYKYNVRYDNRDDAGYFVFSRNIPEDSGGNESDKFNPAVLVAPVTAQAAAQTTMNLAFNYVFEHADTFMTLPSVDRIAKINSNSYALSTDYNQNLGTMDMNISNKGIWVRPYTAFENMPLKHGPKADITSYGTFIGFDSDIHKLKRGWSNVGTAYIGYNGAQLRYNNVDSSMNGGMLGLTETFYKGNFFTALTATAGAGVMDSRTMYGSEDSAYIMGGIGSKTGYNFEFKEGKFIIQPIMFMSYSMVKGFDYTNAAGVRINSDPSHTVELNPSIRFIGNIKGWQPYASVGMVWDVLHESNTKANGIKLPEMYTKPYVQYGVGLQRCWDDKFSAFGQAMVRNGGRNGISLTFGLRWAFGRCVEKVLKSVPKISVNTKKPIEIQNKKRTVLKQLSEAQKLRLQKI